jgi:cation:H+ antiporter
MCLIAAAAIGVAGNQIYFDHIDYHQLFASTGILFLFFFLIFMRYVYGEAAASDAHHVHAKTRGLAADSGDGEQPHAMGKSILFVAIGLAGLVFGGEFIVDGASGIARSLGMAERVIGLVIVGPGTSFPELIASIAAARKKEVGMVIGNVLGSNIFNVFFTLGATAILKPIPLDLALNKVIVINILVTAALTIFVAVLRRRRLGRVTGALLVATYAGYIANALIS